MACALPLTGDHQLSPPVVVHALTSPPALRPQLLTGHFCVTLPHARSSSYRAVFGTSADPAQRHRIEALYDTFKGEVRQQYGYQYGNGKV